jgi:hypothetical protein
MTELSGTLDGVGFRPLLQFLDGLNKSGTLIIEDQQWSGALALAEGRIVGAQFGRERGLEALDAIFFALQHGRFQFSSSDACEVNLVMGADALADHLDALEHEVQQVAAAVPSLGAVPRVVEPEGEGHVSVGRAALRLLLALDERSTVAEHATERGLVTTLRAFAELTHLELVTMAQPASQLEAAELETTDISLVAAIAGGGQMAASPAGHKLGAEQPAVAARNGRTFWRRGLASR